MNCASKPRVISDDHNYNCNANVIESLGHLLASNPGISYVLDFLTVLEKKAASQYLECKVWVRG